MEQLAIRHNPTIAQATERFEQARGRARQAVTCPNPSVIWGVPSLGAQATAGPQRGLIQQPIIAGGKLRINRSRYEVDVEIGRWNCYQQ